MRIRTHHMRGFTLIETLIAVSILMTAIVGPLVFTARSLSGSSYVRDQIAAYYLAQEALDVVRSVRDNNSLVSENWDTMIKAQCNEGCTVDAFSLDQRLEECSPTNPTSCVVLRTDSDGLRFYHQGSKSGGTDSIFRRYVTYTNSDLTQEPNDQSEAVITVTVKWMSGLIPRTLVLKENMFDWK